MSFPSQIAKYDAKEVSKIIDDMKCELEDERSVREALKDDSKERTEIAKIFMAQNAEAISEQLDCLRSLDSEIRYLVRENKILIEADVEYCRLIESPSFIELSQKIGEIYSLSASLDDFLVREGRRGRPPLPL
jgi:hypothetical protein